MKALFTVDRNAQGKEAEVFLSGRVRGMGKQRISVAFHKGFVRVNGKPASPHQLLLHGDKVEIDTGYFNSPRVFPEKIPLDIRYEDDDLMVVVKPAGMACHAGLGNYYGTLLNALSSYFDGRHNVVLENGLVQRLDKETEGLMIVAKNKDALGPLLHMIKKHQVKREYLTLVSGRPEPSSGTINLAIGRDPDNKHVIRVLSQEEGGKEAVTHYEIKRLSGPNAWVSCRLETGRTHQIRIHMAAIGHPVIGDKRYGIPGSEERLMLFSTGLEFIHPVTGHLMSFSYIPDSCRTSGTQAL